MDEFAERQMLVASDKGEKADAADAEESVRLSRGQTPTIDAEVYDPQQLRDAGYPLSNPTAQPNRHTKEQTRIFAGRDSATGQPQEPTTPIPVAREMLPSTQMYVNRSDISLRGLTSASGPEAVSKNLSSVYTNMIHYTNSLVDEEVGIANEQSNRIRWNTSDRMETIGFNMLLDSERTEEGVNDKGLDGLQIVMSAQIMRGARSFAEVSELIGDTGANEDQLIETWNKAAEAYQNSAQDIVNAVPETEETALKDTRYIGAMMTVLEADGADMADLVKMTPEEIMSKGKNLADMFKANLVGTGSAVYMAKQDPKIANAIMYMLDVDDALPTTMGDFGRHLGYGVMDPINFIGGAGVIAKVGSKVAGKSLIRAALVKAGATGTIGAATMAAYMGLHDAGMQNVAMAAGRQEDYNPWQTTKQTALGAGIGFILGAGISGLTDAGAALIGKLRKPVSEFDDVPIPDNVIPENELTVRRQLRTFMEEDKLRKMADDEELQKEFIELANEAAELEEKRLTLIKGGAKEADPDHMAQMELVDAELLEKEYAEYPRAKPPVRTHDDAYNQAGIDAGISGEEISPKRMQEMDEEWAAKQLEFADEPWIGVINKEGKHEFRNRGEGEAADWHHSMAIKNIDDWDADSSLSFYRPGDAKELVIKGDSALDPMKKGKAQIKELAKKLKEQGVPGDYQLRVEEMGLHTDYEGQTIGTIDQWIKKR